MKRSVITLLTCLAVLFAVATAGHAAPGGIVTVGPDGITFQDNSVQNSAAILPGCSTGGVLVNISGAWLCGHVMPVVNGIATCVGSACSVSACLTGFANCDGIQGNGCESSLATVQNCGGCGITCPAGESCISSACFNPNKPASISLAANPAAGITNGIGPVTLTATLIPVDAANGTIAAGTPVTFTILSGSGTLSATTVPATAGAHTGVATVTLNSTDVGSVSVNAAVGGAPPLTSTTVAVPFVAQPALVVVKLATVGTLPPGTLIGGIQATVTASPSSGLSIQASDATATAFGTGSLFSANTTSVASVPTALINLGGFPVGEFATLTYHVANGTFPLAGGFGVTPLSVIDALGSAIPGVSVVIQSVTVQ